MINVNGRWSCAVASACALLVLSAGCDRRSESTKAVEQSAHDLHALSGGSPEPATSESQTSTFTKVSKDLGPAVSGSSAGDKAAASLMMCQTQVGLGEQAASDAASQERAALNSITQIQALLSNWRMRSAIAAAAEAYNPSAQRAEIAKSKQEKDAAIAAEQQHRAQVQGQLDDLKGRAKQKMDGAGAKEAEYGRLTQQAVKLTATEAVPLVEQANKIKREADGLRLEGAKLEAQAQSIAPLVTEIDAVISQLTNQKKDLDETDAALAKQLSDAKAEASTARADATKANVDLEKQVDDLAKLRNEHVIPAYEKAVGLFTKASSAARDATQLAPSLGKAAQGDAQMSIADMHWQRGQGLKNYALLLEGLAGAQPALPKQAQFAEGAKAARDQAKTEMEAASSALENAKQSFEGAGGRLNQDAKDKLDNLGKLLEAAVKVSKDNATGVTPELAALTGRSAAPSAPSTPPGAPPANTNVDPALLTTIDAYLAAAREGRVSELMSMTYIPDSAKPSMQPMVDFTSKYERLDKAFRSKFRTSLMEAASSNPMMGAMAGQMSGAMGDVEKLKSLKASDFKITMEGDIATATTDASPKPVTFKKFDGKWMVFDKDIETSAPQLAAMAPMIAPMTKAFDETASEVEAGKYADANAAMAALGAKLQAAMSGLMGNPPGGGKKGPGGG